MDSLATCHYGRIAISLLVVAALWGCGPGDDKGKAEKTAPPKPAAPATEAPKPAPKAKPKIESELPGGWKLLGQEQADRESGKDRIRIGGKQGRFQELRILVHGAPVTIDEMIVTFGNDKQFRPELKQAVKDRVIKLPGKQSRAIKRVELVHRAGDKSTVLIYGR